MTDDDETLDEEPIYVAEQATAQEDAPPALPDQCNEDTWAAVMRFVAAIVANVRYGPGRGLFEAGRFLITYAPGRHSVPGDINTWRNVLGVLFAAFHCTSFTNVFLAWLLRRNESFTHAGNIPDLDKLVTWGPEPRWVKDAGNVSGYGDACYEIESNGSTAARVRSLIDGKAYIDAMELYERRGELPTFVVFMQSSKFGDEWMTWHHTGVLAFRDGRMYRIAADGSAPKHIYSAGRMHWTEITEENISSLDICRYRVFGVRTNADGSYGDQSKPIAEIEFEFDAVA